MPSIPRILLLIVTLVLLQGCSGDADSPEEQVRKLIESGVQAGEARSVDGIVELVHESYTDQRGQNRKQLAGLLRLFFLRHKNIHLFTRIDSVEILSDNEASVSLHVAMAGTVISDVDALARLSARVYRFDIQLIRDEDWRVLHAGWEPASLSAFE